MDINFKITLAAANKITKLITNSIQNTTDNNTKNLIYFRIEITAGGCSGFQYKYNITKEKISTDDIIFTYNIINEQVHFKIDTNEIDNTYNIVLDTKSLEFLKNAELDHIENLGESYFKMNNQDAKAKCGCGNSFNV